MRADTRADRRVEVSRRYGSAVVRQQDRVRQVRGAWPPHRRAAELERATEQQTMLRYD